MNIKDILALLKEREWNENDSCLTCYSFKKDGHHKGCKLGEILKRPSMAELLGEVDLNYFTKRDGTVITYIADSLSLREKSFAIGRYQFEEYDTIEIRGLVV